MKPNHTTLQRLAGLTCLLGLLSLPSSLFGQGCVIARGGGGAMITDGGGYLEPKEWNVNVAFRWFKSDRHFIGDVEQKHRKANGTQVINNSRFYDVSATYAWSKRLNTTLTVPYVTHNRSSLYEHRGNNGPRGATQSDGFGDLRLSASYWAFDPNSDHLKGNLAIGFGVKLPTGDYKDRDIFNRPAGPTVRFVDSSIQPADGGLGFTIELQGFRHLVGNLSTYGNMFYLFNPEGRIEATGFSIPDAYMARGGFDYRINAVRGLTVSLGGRVEGVPSHDAFGSSIGSRRPGFSVAVEPGVTFNKGRFTGTVTVPVAVHHRRITTFGAARPGDAAFADYSINTSFSIRL